MSNILSKVQQTAIGSMSSATSLIGASSALDYVDVNKANVDGGSNVGSLVGAGIGSYFGWKKKPSLKNGILGAILGESVGRNAPELLKAGQRRNAIVNIAETGAAVVVAKRSTKHPIIGFIVGRAIAGLVVHFGGLRG